MAAAADPHDVLCSTDGKENFIRLTRLLISGGTTLLRETFDMIISPSTLPTTLNNSSTKGCVYLSANRFSMAWESGIQMPFTFFVFA